MTSTLNKIETSFKLAMKGQESLNHLIYWWGVIGYLVAYFILDRLVKLSSFRSIDIIISLLTSFYFIWHIYVLRRCSPKKPKLSKEEKKALREEARRNFSKKVLRKLLLQESITKWNPVLVCTVTDVFCIATFLDYVFR